MAERTIDVRTTLDMLLRTNPGAAVLPEDVRLAILAAAEKDVFPVTGNSAPFAESVVRARVISFGPGARLRFASTSSPFVVIFAQEVKFSEIPTQATIGFVDIPVPHAEHRPPAKNGADGDGYRSSNKGKPGGDGADGTDGVDGGTIKLPTVYLLANGLLAPPNPDQLPYITFQLNGVAGGNGGNGGQGGKGGDGHDGRNSKDTLGPPPRCKRQAASGGAGGNGGKGGKPGNAGNGSDGADLTLYGPAAVIDLLEFT